MTRWSWLALISLVVIGMGFVINVGMTPKPVRMVKPSYFDSPEAIGALIWSRFGKRFRSEPNMVIGVQPGSVDQERVALGFLSAAEAAGVVFKQRIKEARLDLDEFVQREEKGKTWISLNLQKSNVEFLRYMSTAGNVFIFPSTFTSHVIGNTPVFKAEKKIGKKVLTISFVNLATSLEALGKLKPVCDGRAAFGEDSIAALGCAARRQSLMTFRKKMDRTRYVMAMEQTGEKDYLVFVAPPKRVSK